MRRVKTLMCPPFRNHYYNTIEQLIRITIEQLIRITIRMTQTLRNVHS
jgi:hypothetical protein